MREVRHKFQMMGKQNHVVWLMKRLSLNDLEPFDLHPAGCRRLAIGLSVGLGHFYLGMGENHAKNGDGEG
jgi:hypothetical protein